MDLLTILAIIYAYLIFTGNNTFFASSKDDSDGLTETQRNWRKLKEQEKQKLHNFKVPRRSLSKEELFYKRLRPWKLSEWIVWAVDPRFLKAYLFIMVAGLFISLLFTGGISLFIIIICDMVAYKWQLNFEAMDWDLYYFKDE